MSGDHNMYQKDKSYLDFECPRCGHCCQTDLARVGEVGVWGDGQPVAWYDSLSGWTDFGSYRPHRKPSGPSAEWIPLYASTPKKELTCVCGAVWDGEQMVHAPRKREWVGLTDEEIGEVISGQFAERNYWVKITKALESKLKEKNT